MLCTNGIARVQRCLSWISETRIEAVVRDRVVARAASHRDHGHRPLVFEPRHGSVRKGDDTQGVPAEHGEHGGHYGTSMRGTYPGGVIFVLQRRMLSFGCK